MPLEILPADATAHTQILWPPHAWLGRFSGDAPIGSILVADLRGGVGSLSEGLGARHTTPWCPLCLVSEGRLSRGQAASFSPYDGAFGLLTSPREAGQLMARDVVSAIRQRPSPTSTAIAQFVAIRTRRRELVGPLVEALEANHFAPSARTFPQRTLSRKIRKSGTLGVRNWAGIRMMIDIMTRPSSPGVRSLEQLALEYGVDPRSLRSWLRLCTSLPFSVVATIPGWEWLLEGALRRWGYLRSLTGSLGLR